MYRISIVVQLAHSGIELTASHMIGGAYEDRHRIASRKII